VKKEIQPVDNNVVKNITQTKLTVIKEGDEEKAIPDNVQLAEVEYVSDQDDAGNSPQKCKKKSNEDSFCKMDQQSLKDLESYAMKWGSEKDDVVVWKILKDGESVSLHDNTFFS
jgi:hypothetical protein